MNTSATTLGLFIALTSMVIVIWWAFVMKKIPKPVICYIRIFMSIGILILVWAVWGIDNKIQSAQFILTALALGAMIKEILVLKNFYSKA